MFQRIAGGFVGLCAGLALLGGLSVQSLLAQPTGGQVAAGSAVITGEAGALTVTQTSDRAILTWQDFSIGAGGLVRFIQPDAASATLNRVVSGLPSALDGRLEANGRVFLINPNGILVGADARIDTAGFLASTLDVTNQDFLAGGDLHFSGGSTAAIQNLGAINALGGDVFLIARQVENAGTVAVTAGTGTAGVAAGSEVLLTTGGDERLFVLAASAPGAIVNAGTITGATAELKAAGGNAYALAINNAGTVRATGSAVRGGQVWLVATGEGSVGNSGVLDASSATGQGGQVSVTGGRVTLAEGSLLDASGATGGGRILVFGGMTGEGSVDVQGSLDASATTGDGGFIETSAARVTVADGARVTTTSPDGRNGTWLIDPVDFTIAASGGDMTGAAVGTALAGGNFAIQSTTGGSGTAGDVNVNDVVSWSANKLTLNAQNNINVNAVMNASGTASLALEYGQGAVAAGNTSDYLVRAAVNLPAGNNFSTKLGSDGAVLNYTVITSLGEQGSSTTTDLQGMRGNRAGLYALGADIDASATSGWNGGAGYIPIGTNGFAFNGQFAGLGHTICDLVIERPTTDYVGLFGYISSSVRVRDVGIVGDSSIKGRYYVGALVGYISGGTVSNSYATDVTLSAAEAVGGLVGRNYNAGTIRGSYATGSVSSTSGYAGGLVAENNGTLIDSYATASVSGNNNVGGLAGGGGGTFTNTYATGNVTGVSNSIGGLVGGSFGTITNSYATGTVAGGAAGQHVGGLVGYNIGDVINSYATGGVTGNGSNLGGLVGANGNSNGTVTTSYATGLVTSTGSSVGGLVGNNDGTVNPSFWNSEVNGVRPGIGGGDTTGATGLTTAQMRTAASFSSFVFTSTPGASGNNWVIVDADGTLNNAGAAAGATYPMLASEYSTTIRSGHQLQLIQMAPDASYTLGTPVAALSTGNSKDVWGSAGFVPLVTFTGTLDGLGRTISDLTINRPATDNVGLFGTGQGSTIRNVGLLNPAVTGQQQVGALVGSSSGVAISTSYVIGGTVTGTTNIGGMIGRGGSGGFHPPIPTSITNGYTSNVNVTGTANVGGLVGFNAAGSITNGYSASTVTGTSNVGGLLGSNLGNPGTITHSFWNKTVSATGIGSDALPGDTAGATGMTAAQMQQQANFTAATAANGNVNPAWNFTNTWVMYDGHTAPLLRVFMTPLRVEAGNVTKTYDGLAYSGGSSVYCLDCIDSSLLLGTIGYGGTSQGAVNVGSYAITPQGLYSNQQGYIITFAPGTLTVNKADLTLSGSRSYDGSTTFAGSNLTATGVNSETFTVGGAGAAGNLTTKDVQTGQVLASVTGLSVGTGNTGAALATNYNVLSVTGSTVSVTAADLTLSGTRVYDGTTIFAGSNLTATGVNGETFSVSGTGGAGNLTTKNVQTAALLANVTGLTLGTGNSGAALATNYNGLSTTNSSVSVTPKALTIAGFASDNKVYNGTTAAVIATPGTLTGVVLGDTVGFSQTGATFDTKDVGTGKTVTMNGVTLTGSGDETNYTHTATITDLSDITPATLTYTATPTNRTYGSDNPTLGGTINDFVNSETQVTATTGTLTFTTTATVGSNVGTYAINGSGLTANNGNYVFTQAAGNATALTINPANLVLTGTRVYDGTTIFAGSNLTATGVNGQTFTVNGAGATGNLGTRNVQTGQRLASVSGLGVGTGNSGAAIATNYNALATTGSSVSVTAAGLTVSTSDVIKTYDGGTSALGTPVVTVGTLFGADALAGGTFAFVGKDVGAGNKTVTVAGVTVNDGNSGFNYTLTLADNTTSTINPAALTLSGTRVYDGTTIFAGANLTAAGVNGESFTVTGAGATGNLGTRNVQTSELLASVSGLGVGTGNSGAAIATNYNALATTGSSVSVTPKALTITADDQAKVYGAADPTLTATYAGLVNTDDASVVTGLLLSTATGALATAGSHAITAAGATAANYTVTLGNGTLAVTPASLAVTANAQTKLYGNADPALTYGVGTLYYTDTAAGVLTGALTRTAGETVAGGPYQIGVGTLSANANYTVAYTRNELTITPVTLTYVADAASRFVGAANPAFSGTVTGFVTGEALATATTGTLAFGTPATAASPVGTYAINGSGLTANQGNYVFVQAPPNATALTINPVSGGTTPLTITADDKAKLYGAVLPAFTASFNGFINGDTSASVTGLQFSTSATMSSNVGTYTITPFGATAPSTYLVGYVPGTLTINPALLNIFADNKSAVYGAALPAFTASLSGFVNGDTSASVTGLQFASTASVGSNAGTYAITPSGATAANYTPVYHPGALTISPAALTLTAGSAQRPFGTANPPFSVTGTGFANGDTLAVVSGLVISTPATPTSAVGSYAITPSGGTASNYSLTYISGVLQVLAPTVIVGTDTETVVTIDDEPVVSDEFAVIEEGDRLVLVVVNEPGDDSAPVDERLTLTLQDASAPVVLDRVAGVDSTRSVNTLNFGNFEPVAGAGGTTRGGGGGGPGQAPEPGLFRESTVNMGGFNIVYHEAVSEARTQAEGNTALGSSYREFSDAENPQVNIVRAKAEPTPSDSPAPGNAPTSL